MDNPRMSELMEALLFASFFATPRHLYVGGGETTPDAGSTAHLALYAASAFVICTLIYKLVSSLSWLNPPAARGPHREAAATAAERRAASQHHRTPAAVTAPARDCPPAAQGSHFREAAATVAERRAASQPPSPHHRQTAMESSNADASAAQYAPKPPTTRPPSRLQLNTGPKQPNPPPTPKARSQHHRTPAAVTAPACDWAEGWGDFGLEHLSEPERKRKRAQENDGGAKRRKS
mmetsp:Transcript_7064/g.14667  ORF Transcript_7064/g.14667 Transcript_7064/m.14667 type:complete len:235 (-) Transcript_7064:285-989(-)